MDMDSFRGKVTLVTFIYTRCPFPDYCPLVSNNFAQIYAAARSNPALFSKLRLMSISFDPTNDTPKVLRAYGKTFEKTTGGEPFGHWQFATAAPKELEKITNFFGVLYDPSQKDIVHSLSTSVIGPQGKFISGTTIIPGSRPTCWATRRRRCRTPELRCADARRYVDGDAAPRDCAEADADTKRDPSTR